MYVYFFYILYNFLIVSVKNVSSSLQHGFVRARPGSIDQRISRRSSIPVGDGTSDEQFLEGFPELSGHPAVDGKVDGVAQNDEEIAEKY